MKRPHVPYKVRLAVLERQANKVGKAHGVQVQRSELPNDAQYTSWQPKSHAVYHMDIPDSLRRELLTQHWPR
jgi:hypothetical protein